MTTRRGIARTADSALSASECHRNCARDSAVVATPSSAAFSRRSRSGAEPPGSGVLATRRENRSRHLELSAALVLVIAVVVSRPLSPPLPVRRRSCVLQTSSSNERFHSHHFRLRRRHHHRRSTISSRRCGKCGIGCGATRDRGSLAPVRQPPQQLRVCSPRVGAGQSITPAAIHRVSPAITPHAQFDRHCAEELTPRGASSLRGN